MRFRNSPIAIIGDMFSSRFNMKASSYFTDGEIELAMGILGDLLTNKEFLDEVSISHDATDKYYKLVEKIDVYFNDMKIEDLE